MNNSPINRLDDAFVKTERVVVPVTQLMKDALTKVAYDNRMTVAELVRASIFHYAEIEYPEFGQIYSEKAKSLLRETDNGK